MATVAQRTSERKEVKEYLGQALGGQWTNIPIGMGYTLTNASTPSVSYAANMIR